MSRQKPSTPDPKRRRRGHSALNQTFDAAAADQDFDAKLEERIAKCTGGRYKCPLDCPNLGVISQNDHRLGTCLCKYCRCGKHKCPGVKFLDPYPKDMFTSQYQAHHQPGDFQPSLKPMRPLHRQNPNQMEMLSTYERDYPPFRIEPTNQSFTMAARPKTASVGRSPPVPKFTGLSSYRNEYPDWGSANPTHMKRTYQPVPTQDLKFHGGSLYANDYIPFTLGNLTAKTPGMNAHSSLGVPGRNARLMDGTTYGNAFKPSQDEYNEGKYQHPYDKILATSNPPNLYQSEYKEKYIPQEKLIRDLPSVRRCLESIKT